MSARPPSASSHPLSSSPRQAPLLAGCSHSTDFGAFESVCKDKVGPAVVGEWQKSHDDAAPWDVTQIVRRPAKEGSESSSESKVVYVDGTASVSVYEGGAEQKLTYFAQAWSLGLNGRKLFSDEIEAWRDGPVVRSVYRENRYGVIPTYRGRLDAADQALIDAVLAKYDGLSAQQMIDLSHEDKPWQDARGNAPAHVRTTTPIPVGAIRKLYAARVISGSDSLDVSTQFAPVSDEVAARAGAGVVARWKSALDLLATR